MDHVARSENSAKLALVQPGRLRVNVDQPVLLAPAMIMTGISQIGY
jgi:hypothetical protein